MVKKTRQTHIRFDRAHAPGPKLTSGLCLYIGLLVARLQTRLKWLVMKWAQGCCAVGCVHIHTYIHLFEATTQYQNFSKGLLNNMST